MVSLFNWNRDTSRIGVFSLIFEEKTYSNWN